MFFIPHRARQITREDYDRFDLIVGMDRWNRSGILRIMGGDPAKKICLLMDFTDHPGDVADPWYSDRFDIAYADISAGCEALISHLLQA